MNVKQETRYKKFEISERKIMIMIMIMIVKIANTGNHVLLQEHAATAHSKILIIKISVVIVYDHPYLSILGI